jgi:hypothetical protein
MWVYWRVAILNASFNTNDNIILKELTVGFKGCPPIPTKFAKSRKAE